MDFEVGGTYRFVQMFYLKVLYRTNCGPLLNLLRILGYKIKKGWSINLDGVTIHQDPEFYPEPEKFNPSRWDVSFSKDNRFTHSILYTFCSLST